MAPPTKFSNPLGGEFVPSDDEQFDRARLALRAFYRLKPHLSAFARVLTENPKISIAPTGGTSATDGKTIYVRVNPELAESRAHVRALCNKRDVEGLQKCDACRAHENVMVPLYHEIAHVAFESFQKFTDDDLAFVVRAAVDEAAKWGISERRIERIKKSFEDKPPTNYLEAAVRVSPYLPMLLNAVEDARVNALIHTGNPGMAEMFRIRTSQIFRRGIEVMDGRVIHWSEQPRNAQAVIGTFVKASGYPLEGFLLEEIEDDLRDPQLTELCDAVVEAKDAREVYMLALPILERLRALGYCAPEKAEDPDEGEGEPDGEDTGGDNDETGDAGSASDADADDFDNEGDPDADEVDGANSEGDGTHEEADDDAEADAEGGSTADNTEDSDEDDDATGGDDSGDPDAEGDYADDGDPDGEMDAPDDEEGDTADAGDPTGGAGADGSGDEPSDEGGSPDGGAGGDPGGVGADEPDYDTEFGTPEDVEELLKIFGEHENDDEPEEEQPDVEKAIQQDNHFDTPSSDVVKVSVKQDSDIDSDLFFARSARRSASVDHAPEAIIQKCMGPIRIAFSENQKASMERNRKSGRVNARVLGRRVPVDDPRLFKKKRLPGKRDYEVLIGLDVSGSTAWGPLPLIKASAWAQAELLSRIGVPFRMYAHTGTMCEDSARYGDLQLDIGVIKDINEPWSEPTKDRLRRLKSAAANLDGHTMEFYRKRLEESRATKKILMYYTDGAMPAENYFEEKEILERECRLLKSKPDFEVIGVGIRNEDPTQYGLDTVRIDDIEDVHYVVDELRKRLANG